MAMGTGTLTVNQLFSGADYAEFQVIRTRDSSFYVEFLRRLFSITISLFLEDLLRFQKVFGKRWREVIWRGWMF